MLAVDESLGSIEELSESVHQQLDTHLDSADLLHYEVNLLQTQIAEKNRLVSSSNWVFCNIGHLCVMLF